MRLCRRLGRASPALVEGRRKAGWRCWNCRWDEPLRNWTYAGLLVMVGGRQGHLLKSKGEGVRAGF